MKKGKMAFTDAAFACPGMGGRSPSASLSFLRVTASHAPSTGAGAEAQRSEEMCLQVRGLSATVAYKPALFPLRRLPPHSASGRLHPADSRPPRQSCLLWIS